MMLGPLHTMWWSGEDHRPLLSFNIMCNSLWYFSMAFKLAYYNNISITFSCGTLQVDIEGSFYLFLPKEIKALEDHSKFATKIFPPS